MPEDAAPAMLERYLKREPRDADFVRRNRIRVFYRDGGGAHIAALWEDFAARRGIILVAPDALHRDAWRLKDDSPNFLHAVVNEVQTRYAADRRRLYLFGQSGGAVYGLTLAMLESDYFAAIAIHAGAWRLPAEFKAIP